MRVVILTTQTAHHTYFVKELLREFSISQVFIEDDCLSAPFDIHHCFEDRRDVYEADLWFQGNAAPSIENYCEVFHVNRINESVAQDKLKVIVPDVIISFGVGKIYQEVIDICPDGIINLHGGDPEYYRGLDSHLWAIYHGDWDRMTVTLHRLNSKLDDGHIIKKGKIDLCVLDDISQLRAANTQICIELVISALRYFRDHGNFESYPQKQIGRYYSFMPEVLKEICERKFNKKVCGNYAVS